MRRAFLFGGAVPLFLIPISILLFPDETREFLGTTGPETVVAGIFSLALAGLVLILAKRAPPSTSLLATVCGWVLGLYAFLAMIGVLLAVGNALSE
jgi:hypothetical protein